MDDQLAFRLKVFRTTEDIPGDVVDFVQEELHRIDPGENLTDSRAGMFVSHAIQALARAVRGDTVAEGPSDVAYREAAQDTAAIAAAHAFADRARARLGAELPDNEVRFLTLHFATINIHTRKGKS